jgi:hypothetical protein
MKRGNCRPVHVSNGRGCASVPFAHAAQRRRYDTGSAVIFNPGMSRKSLGFEVSSLKSR